MEIQCSCEGHETLLLQPVFSKEIDLTRGSSTTHSGGTTLSDYGSGASSSFSRLLRDIYVLPRGLCVWHALVHDLLNLAMYFCQRLPALAAHLAPPLLFYPRLLAACGRSETRAVPTLVFIRKRDRMCEIIYSIRLFSHTVSEKPREKACLTLCHSSEGRNPVLLVPLLADLSWLTCI
jgi:hypothetical protein